MNFPECGLCDGMRICSCKSEPIDKRFIAACYAMQGILSATPDSFAPVTFTKQAVQYADALLEELERE